MKTFIYTVAILLFLSCSQKEQPDGWYLITDTETMTIDKTPIVTVSDFEALQIDSVLQPASSDRFPGQMAYSISGNIKADKVAAFADATEKQIGKQIGFLYNGEIITAPQVNMRIESGKFAITPSFMNDRERMMQLYNDLKR